MAAGHRIPAPIRYTRTGEDVDPSTPVIVGVGQVADRESGGALAGRDPASLAVRALRRAAEDSGVGTDLLSRADSVRYVASVSWQYPDGAALIAETLGAQPKETVQTTLFGGDGSLRLLNDTAQAIADGTIDVALIAGAESGATAAAAHRSGEPTGWPKQPDGTAPTRVLGVDAAPNNEAELAAGLFAPIYVYALIESAIRRRRGATPAEHLAHISTLWSQFSGVAADNPYAWRPERMPADRLATPTADNRPISAPYPKLLTANLQVDQATGVIMCSAAAAQDAGIPQDNWVFVHAGAHATDEWFVSERADLAESPAIRALGTAVLSHAGIDIDQVRHVDLYACFPSAVQIAAAELGLPVADPDRPLTVTGGLTFGGGPGNNYTSHAVCNLVDRLRADPDTYGLATALGWYVTKHSIAVFSARPPRARYQDIDADPRVIRPTPRHVHPDYTGPAVLEAYTVPYGRDGNPEAAIITALIPDGDRIVLRTTDSDVVERIATTDPIGWHLTVTGSDEFTVDDPTQALLRPGG